MHSLQNCQIDKALFISPILDMEQLILDMMKWADVTEEELAKKVKYKQILVKHYLGNIYVLLETIQ